LFGCILNNFNLFIVSCDISIYTLFCAPCNLLKIWVAYWSDYVHNLILQFLGTLTDSNMIIRSSTRKILKLVKLPNIELFRLFVDGLIESLEKHPQVCFVGPACIYMYVCKFLLYSVTSLADSCYFFPGWSWHILCFVSHWP